MENKTNKMTELRVEKVTLNMGTGKDQATLDKGLKVLGILTNGKPVKTITQKRVPEWGVRPGLPVGCKITLRKKAAEEMIMRILEAKTYTLEERNFDEMGTVSIGIPEYIDIKGAKYDPEIGIIGLQACITLERPGYRVKRRKKMPARLAKNHRINKADAIEFMKKRFNVKIGEQE